MIVTVSEQLEKTTWKIFFNNFYKPASELGKRITLKNLACDIFLACWEVKETQASYPAG